MEEGPRTFVEEGDFRCLKGLYYRFQKDSDIVLLFEYLRKIYRDFGGLGSMLKVHIIREISVRLSGNRANTFFMIVMP